MKEQEWREKSGGEREKAILEFQDKARKLRFDLATRETKNHSEYGKIKKDIARMMTLRQEAEMDTEIAEESK